MTSARASKVALVALVLGAGCANLDGLSGGVAGDGGTTTDAANTDAAPPRDASGDAATGSDAAPRDASGTDAPAASDAPVDAPIPVDAADAAPPGTWCATQSPAPTFCTDFDVSALNTGWTNVYQNNGTVALTTMDRVSLPNAVQATTGPVTANSTARASFEYDAIAAGTHVHIEWQLRPTQIDPAAQMKTGGLGITDVNGVDLYNAFIIVTAAGSYLEESYAPDGGPPVFHDTSLAHGPVTGTWNRMTMDFVLPSAGGPVPTVTVHIGADNVLASQPLYGGGMNGKVVLNVGLELYTFAAALGPCQLEIDDVLMNVSP